GFGSLQDILEGSRGLGSSRECWGLWGFWVVFGVLEISGGFGEPLRCFGGVWGILGGFRGGSGVSLRCLGGLWGCLPLLTTPPAVCVLYTQSPGSHQWREFGRTEVIDNSLNPDFLHKFVLDYCFEERQNLRFDLYDVDSKSPDLSKHVSAGSALLPWPPWGGHPHW
uniref:C2 domain-containing protein n=1 Tax=Taeniopygia guttata TaxID=59729 RepID=A0A674H867_TAEGU